MMPAVRPVKGIITSVAIEHKVRYARLCEGNKLVPQVRSVNSVETQHHQEREQQRVWKACSRLPKYKELTAK
jgi:hypothetical protein